MGRGRLAVALGLLVIVGAATSIASGTPTGAPTAHGLQCGEERWPVKTLSDSRAHLVNFHPDKTTVNHLRHLPRPDVGTNSPRFPGAERTTFKVNARLIEFVTEDDRDVHLVIASVRHPSQTMIVEFPDVRCQGAKQSIKKKQLRNARNDLIAACGSPSSSFADLHGKATITGVGFFDLVHGQTGIAPNAIELHPVLKFAHATC